MAKLFKKNLVRIVERFENKAACLEHMTQLLANCDCLQFPDRFIAAIKGREDIMSTGIGREIAIPHARDLTVTCLRVAVCMLIEPLEFNSFDNLPVRLVFMIAVPQNTNQEYMKILRSMSEFLRQDENRQNLLSSQTEDELYTKISELDHVIAQNLQL